MTRPARTELKQDFLAVRAVLRTVWNPLGIEGLPEDEYDSYVWPVVGLLREGIDEEGLAWHLREVEVFYFSRAADGAHLRRVASALIALQPETGTDI
jgi:hypothetical protein